MSTSGSSARRHESEATIHSVENTVTDQTKSEDTKRAAVQLRHVLLLGGLTAFGPLSTDMYLPALPTVGQELSATTALTQLTLTSSIFGLALGQLVVGPASDVYGRRRPLLLGVGIFVLASLLCGIAPSVGVLIGLRLVQGVAGAAGVVIALAVARDLYSGLALARCIALLMSVNFLAPIIAPVLGGQILGFASWRSIFAAIALIAGVFWMLVAWGLHETLERPRRREAGVGSTIWAFRQLLSSQHFLGYALVCSFAFAVGIVYISASPFVLQHVYGLTPQRFSLIFAANAIGLAMMSQLGARLIQYVSPRTLLLWGVSLMAGATAVLLGVILLQGGLVGILLSFFVITASLGLIAPNATTLALADTSPQTAGSASALLGVLQFSIGAAVAPLVGLAGAATALPMAAVMAAFGLAALATAVVLSRTGPGA